MQKARRKAPAPPPPSESEAAFASWAQAHNETEAAWLDRLEAWATPIAEEYAELVRREHAKASAMAAGLTPRVPETVPLGTHFTRARGPIAVETLQSVRQLRDGAADPVRTAFRLGLAVQRLNVLEAEAVAASRTNGKYVETVFLHGHAIHVTRKLEAWFGVFRGDVAAVDTPELVRTVLGRLDHHEAGRELRKVRDAGNELLAAQGVPLRVRADTANGVHHVEELPPERCGK